MQPNETQSQPQTGASLVQPGESVVRADPAGNWAIINQGGTQLMRVRSANGQISEQVVPQQQAAGPQGMPASNFGPSTGQKMMMETATAFSLVAMFTSIATMLKSFFVKK